MTMKFSLRFTLIFVFFAVTACNKCDLLGQNSEIKFKATFVVDSKKTEEFNYILSTYLRNNGFHVEQAKRHGYLSPPNRFGRQTAFTNIQTTGCAFRTVVWAENTVKENEFIVTIHETAFGNAQQSKTIEKELVAELRSANIYPASPHTPIVGELR
jgi:hypothetical protein